MPSVQYKCDPMNKLDRFTACPEPDAELLVSSRSVLQSEAATEAFNEQLKTHHVFWMSHIARTIEAFVKQEGGRREVIAADIVEAKIAVALNFRLELAFVMKGVSQSRPPDSKKAAPVARRGLSLLSLSTLYQRIILAAPPGELPAVEQAEGVTISQADVVPDMLEDDSGQTYGYALHVAPETIAGHFEDNALPFMFSENWCAAQGLYVRCLKPAKPEVALYTSPQIRKTNPDFDNMVTMYPYLGAAPSQSL